MGRRFVASMASVIIVGSMTLAGISGPVAAQPVSDVEHAQIEGASATVTLPTGDHVRVGTGGDGVRTLAFEPAPARDGVTPSLYTWWDATQAYVMPGDASGADDAEFAVTQTTAADESADAAQTHTLTVRGITHDGSLAHENAVAVADITDGGEFAAIERLDNGEATLSVPAGTYAITALLSTGPIEAPETMVATAALDVEVSGNTTVELDARDAEPITVETPAHDTDIRNVGLDIQLGSPNLENGAGSSFTSTVGVATELFAVPTDGPEEGFFDLHTTFSLVGAGEDPAEADLRYDLGYSETAVDGPLSYVAELEDLARVDTRLSAHFPDSDGGHGHGYVAPRSPIVHTSIDPISLPQTRTAYFSTDPDGAWFTLVSLDGAFGSQLEESDYVSYEPGSRQSTTWHGQPVAPALRGAAFEQNGDRLLGFVTPYVDGDGHVAWDMVDSSDELTEQFSHRVLVDGEEVTSDEGLSIDAPLPSEAAELRIEFEVERSAPWLQRSSATWTRWDTTTTSGDDVLPVLDLQTSAQLDLLNRTAVTGGGAERPVLDIEVTAHEDAAVAAIEDVRVWLSGEDDDGWREVGRVQQTGDMRYRATLPPTGTGDTDLRIMASDADGNRVEQEIANAWAAHPDATDDRVTRLPGDPGRIQTAVSVSQERYRSADAVILARADDYPDALAGATLAQQLGGPILLTGSDRLEPDVADEIARLGADVAVLLGGSAALSDGVADDVEELGVEVDRVDGANRFETSALVADRLDPRADAAIVAEGGHGDALRGWPDPLAAAPLAATEDMPILLTAHDSLPPETAGALDGLSVQETVVVGGTAAVSVSVEEEIDYRGHAPRRVAGATRYETSVALFAEAEAAGASGTWPWLATGWNWPDALAAGPTVAAGGDTLLLVDGRDLADSPPVKELLEDRVDVLDRAYLLGGSAAISDDVEDDVRGLLD